MKAFFRSKAFRIILGFGFILLSFLVLGFAADRGDILNPSSALAGYDFIQPVSVNFPAPVLKLENLEGQMESLEDFHGQVVLVNNWATWCPPCKAEMPILSDYFRDHTDEGLLIIAINAGESRTQVVQFVEDKELPFTVWLDPGNKSMEAFKNQNLPSSYVIDRVGVVRYAWTGEIDRDTLEKFITPLLKE